jgi:transcriptional regulator with XRE-family HTH domain
MPSGFSAKLGFVLKYLSMSRSQLAAELKVDKSIVGRWMTGAVEPSAHNLARLTAFVAGHVDGFTALDWDRSVEKLGAQFGVNPLALSGNEGGPLARGLPLALLQHVVAATALRGQAYEGFFRSTRPYAGEPGLFIHDHGMIRRDANGLLRLWMGTGGVFVVAGVRHIQWRAERARRRHRWPDPVSDPRYRTDPYSHRHSVRADR